MAAEAERQILVGYVKMFADVVFFGATDLGRVDVKMIAVADNGARIGVHKIDAHLGIFSHPNFSCFCGSILHHGGVLDVFDIRGQRLEALPGMIHELQNSI